MLRMNIRKYNNLLQAYLCGILDVKTCGISYRYDDEQDSMVYLVKGKNVSFEECKNFFSDELFRTLKDLVIKSLVNIEEEGAIQILTNEAKYNLSYSISTNPEREMPFCIQFPAIDYLGDYSETFYHRSRDFRKRKDAIKRLKEELVDMLRIIWKYYFDKESEECNDQEIEIAFENYLKG